MFRQRNDAQRPLSDQEYAQQDLNISQLTEELNMMLARGETPPDELIIMLEKAVEMQSPQGSGRIQNQQALAEELRERNKW
jgi:hypothetical protein